MQTKDQILAIQRNAALDECALLASQLTEYHDRLEEHIKWLKAANDRVLELEAKVRELQEQIDATGRREA